MTVLRPIWNSIHFKARELGAFRLAIHFRVRLARLSTTVLDFLLPSKQLLVLKNASMGIIICKI